jgi:hypothetical protein
MEKDDLKIAVGCVIIFIVGVYCIASSINGFFYDPFTFSLRRGTYCLTGFNRFIFSSSLMFWGVICFAGTVFYTLYKLNIVKRRESNSLPDKYVLPVMAIFILGLVTPLITGANCV